jgi:hypothetical protein
MIIATVILKSKRPMHYLRKAILTFLFICPLASAQTDSQNAQSAGFSAGSAIGSYGSGSLDLSTGQTLIPSFTGTAPSGLTSGYNNSSLYTQGGTQITECNKAGYVTNGATIADASCNAAVTLQNNQNTASLAASDPILNITPSSSEVNASLVSSSSETCTSLVSTTSATTTQATCNDYIESYTSSCSITLNPDCVFVGGPISAISTSGQGASYTEVSTGLYNYSIRLAGVGTVQGGQITFTLTGSPARGSYITVNSNNLDDTAVVVVNDVVVYFGHPNSGGQWFYPTFGTTAQFVWGYQDTLCTSYDGDTGECTESVASQFKLSDSCPISGDHATWCTSDGKLVGRVVEGVGYRSLSLGGEMPIVAGTNTIKVYWGTEAYGSATGGITVTGQIYNVVPVCTTINNCQVQEALVR